MAGNSVKYWSKSNVSNPVPLESGDGFVPFEELGQTGTGFLSSSDASINDYLESILGTYGVRLLSKKELVRQKSLLEVQSKNLKSNSGRFRPSFLHLVLRLDLASKEGYDI